MATQDPPSYPTPTGCEPRLFAKAHRTKAENVAFYVLDEEGKLLQVTIADLKALLDIS